MECDECSKDATQCLCDKCLDKIRRVSYDEGYDAGYKDAQKENND